MKVNVEVERGAEALNQRYGAGIGNALVFRPQYAACPGGSDLKNALYFAASTGVVRSE